MGKRQGMHYFCRIWAQKNHPEGWLRCGAADEARTRYLHLGKVALYQMSYGRMMYVLCEEHTRKWCLRSESNQ